MFNSGIGIEDHRGILLYVHNSIHATQIELPHLFKEHITVSIDLDDICVTISTIYRSPNSDANNDNTLLQLIKEIVNNRSGEKLFIGDFNYPTINWKNCMAQEGGVSAIKFLDCLKGNYLVQRTEYPTRVRGSHTPHILDLVITSENFVEEIEYLSPIGNSDHATLRIRCKWTFDLTNVKENKYCYNKGEYDALRQFVYNEIKLQDFEQKHNINDRWTLFKSVVITATDRFIPLCGTWRHKVSWRRPVDKETVKLIKRKHRLWNRYMETRDPLVERKYKKCRNQVKSKSLLSEKKKQLEVAIECKTNNKKFWAYVKSKSKTISTIGDIKISEST
jgi:hypothetical protein